MPFHSRSRSYPSAPIFSLSPPPATPTLKLENSQSAAWPFCFWKFVNSIMDSFNQVKMLYAFTGTQANDSLSGDTVSL